MKKLLLILLILIAVAVAALAIFLARFDADRYRPALVQRMETALGKPVRLGHLSLAWHGGVALRLQDLKIYADAAAQEEPVVQVEVANALVRLLPLLRRNVEVASLIINRPRLRVSRNHEGQVELLGAAAVAGPAAVVGQRTEGNGAPAAFQIASFYIHDGALHWIDQMTQPATEVWITAIDISLKNVSFTRPIDFDVRVAAFSKDQNLHVQGWVQLPAAQRPDVIEGLQLETNLAQLQLQDLAKVLPQIRQLGLQDGLAGKLEVSCDRLPLDPARLDELQAKARLTNGRVGLARLGSPIETILLEAATREKRLELTRLSARFAGGTITASGAVEQWASPQPRINLEASVEHLGLDAALPKPTTQTPQLRGIVSLAFQGSASGWGWPQISQSLACNGKLELREGMIANFNLLQAVFERISIIPGLVDRLMAKLPASYQEKLAARDTALQPIELPLTGRNGTVDARHFRIGTDAGELEGAASVSVADGTIDSRPILRVEPEMSAAIVRGVNEFQALTDAQGRLELPLIVRLPRFAFQPDSVLPDLQYLVSRLVVSKTQELIGNFINKALDRQGRGAAPEAGPATPPAEAAHEQEPGNAGQPSPQDLLNRLLGPMEPRR